jgi:hypothetical protein
MDLSGLWLLGRLALKACAVLRSGIAQAVAGVPVSIEIGGRWQGRAAV